MIRLCLCSLTIVFDNLWGLSQRFHEHSNQKSWSLLTPSWRKIRHHDPRGSKATILEPPIIAIPPISMDCLETFTTEKPFRKNQNGTSMEFPGCLVLQFFVSHPYTNDDPMFFFLNDYLDDPVMGESPWPQVIRQKKPPAMQMGHPKMAMESPMASPIHWVSHLSRVGIDVPLWQSQKTHLLGI